MSNSFWDKLKESCFAENTYIILAAFICSIVFIICLAMVTEKRIEKPQSSKYYRWAHLFYELFQSIVSIFPLLGLFGTVKALLSIDFSNDIASAQSNFFEALTSTALGIIFAVAFKIFNAFISPRMEILLENQSNQIREKQHVEKSERK